MTLFNRIDLLLRRNSRLPRVQWLRSAELEHYELETAQAIADWVRENHGAVFMGVDQEEHWLCRRA